MRTTQWTSF
jgi:hypothetical protein